MLPTLVTHADWGSHPENRWMARAVLRADSRYAAYVSELVGEPETLVKRLVAQAGPRGCVLLGFDFPIGLPARYAECACIRDFLALLPQLGHGDWSEFYTVAERLDHISLPRPFYPQFSRRKGEAHFSHLLDGLGLEVSELRRRCEQARPGRAIFGQPAWGKIGQVRATRSSGECAGALGLGQSRARQVSSNIAGRIAGRVWNIGRRRRSL
jgi:hypothetical protein